MNFAAAWCRAEARAAAAEIQGAAKLLRTDSTVSRSQAELRPVRPLLFSTAVSVAGDGMLITCAPLLAASVTSDPVAVSLMTAAVWCPWLIVGLVAGALADRWPHVKTMIVADVVRAVVLVLLVVLVVAGHANIYILACGVFVVGSAGCLADSAMQAALPLLLGRGGQSLNHANARFWALHTMGRKLIGPLLGSAFFVIGRTVPLVVDAVTFIISAAAIRRMPDLVREPRNPAGSVLSDIRRGLSFFVRCRELVMVSLGAGAINAAWSCNTAVMVLFCRQVLHIDTIGYGLLLACEAIGGIMAGRYPGRFLNGRPARSTLALIMYLQAITWLTIGLIHSVWVIAICLPVMGFTSTIASVVISGPRQTIPPEHMLGQMLSISRTVGVGAAALGALAGGIISRGLGLTATFYISALILVVAAFIVRFEPNRFCRETAAAPAVEAVDKRPALASVGER